MNRKHVVGDLRGSNEAADPRIVRREDGSWLVDGSLHISDLLHELSLRELPGEEDEGFTTVAGFFLAHLHRIPEPGDNFAIEGRSFEVVDMDGNRIDKVLIAKEPSTPGTEMKL